jgi:Uma2 family endonuclease
LWIEFERTGEVFAAPYQMKTGRELHGREPDVMFVASANLNRTHDKYLEGPADVVFEVVSEESSTRDRLWKKVEYEQGGVPEYWIIDPLKKEVILYLVGEDGRTYDPALPTDDTILRSRVMDGVWFDTEWFWQEEMPATLPIVAQWRSGRGNT